MSVNSNNKIPEELEFKMLDSQLSGSDSVVFQLEDGAQVKIRVSIERAGIATNYTNPDGSQHYNVQASMTVNVISSDKKYKISKTRPSQISNKSSSTKPYA
uniref:Uncharacterized protein n=1 Tax=uncultured marine crenarchaeote KM3-153-F8 TaxID=526665 RepID=B3V657_9ARCH|nr:hypothetical protein [uncultured marine crenarchaeote KM3-153-F8]|tara:strand:- start:179 stop:481 length:303 start_codon:yes stop_codon:yes gene_type:complete